MRLIEYDGKQILRRHGIALPASCLLEPGDGPNKLPPEPCMLKAQSLDGGRGKAGLVLRTTPETAAAQLDELRGRMRERKLEELVLAEALTPPVQEFYVAIRVDGPGQCVTLMVGLEGG